MRSLRRALHVLPQVNLYAVLGIERGASADEIRRAYRQAALALHPDRNPDPDASARFLAVQQAYERLRDPERRAAYDRALGVPFVRLADGPRPQWVPPEGERHPLLFVAGRGWTAWERAGQQGPTRASARPASDFGRWRRDERFAIAVATLGAVAGAVAIAIAPLFAH